MRTSPHTRRARSNALDACVPQDALGLADRPTAAQRAEVLVLLRDDVELYLELEQRLQRELGA